MICIPMSHISLRVCREVVWATYCNVTAKVELADTLNLSLAISLALTVTLRQNSPHRGSKPMVLFSYTLRSVAARWVLRQLR